MWIKIFIVNQADFSFRRRSKTQNTQSSDSLDLLMTVQEDCTEIGDGIPQIRKDWGFNIRQGWSMQRKRWFKRSGLTLLPTVHRLLLEIVLWNGNWAHKKKKQKKNSKQKRKYTIGLQAENGHENNPNVQICDIKMQAYMLIWACFHWTHYFYNLLGWLWKNLQILFQFFF